MNKDYVIAEVRNICREVFENPTLEISETSSAKTIENWDSMTNLILIDKIEKKFNINFSLDEIMEAENIGDLIKVIVKQ